MRNCTKEIDETQKLENWNGAPFRLAPRPRLRIRLLAGALELQLCYIAWTRLSLLRTLSEASRYSDSLHVLLLLTCV